ncbi:MAG: GNAT family N-acetyltransferase [Candidatus ainarchaeum sp.]|nr:GNAT family N-acetyltransferase [Candidatus ainarchaeum sp.]
MEILRAEKKDVKEILPMIQKEFAYAKMTPEKTLRRLRRKNFRIFKAVEAGKIIGFLELEKLDYNLARINGLSVSPEHRKKGFGKQLAKFAVNYLEKKNIRRIIILVKQSNSEAKKLYAETGFKFMRLLENKIENETIEELELNLHPEEDETPSYIG